MKTIKRISVLTHVLITALIIKDEFYLTNALLLPGLKILMSLSLFLRYIIIAASDVLIEVSSWLWRPGTGSMVCNVLVVCMRSLVDPFKQGSEHLLPCEGTSCDDPFGLPWFLRKESPWFSPSCYFFNFLNFTWNGQWIHFSSHNHMSAPQKLLGMTFW